MEKPCTFLVHFDRGTASMASEIKAEVESGDGATNTKADAMRRAISLILNGEPLPHLFITVVRYVQSCDDHAVRRKLLLLLYLETVDKRDAATHGEGDTGDDPHLPEPPRQPAEPQRVHPRRRAQERVPHAPGRWAGVQNRAVAYLFSKADRVADWPDLLQMAAVDLGRKVCRSEGCADKGRYIMVIISLLSASSAAVLYECAGGPARRPAAQPPIRTASCCPRRATTM